MAENPQYLDALPPWSIEQAKDIASTENLSLTQVHLDILLVARDFFAEFGFSPSMRPLCKSVAEQLGLEKGRSLYLNQLFPGSPAKLAAKLAGLPSPKQCI